MRIEVMDFERNGLDKRGIENLLRRRGIDLSRPYRTHLGFQLDSLIFEQKDRVAAEVSAFALADRVQTDDGRPGRIICIDRAGPYSIVALINDGPGAEAIHCYAPDGTPAPGWHSSIKFMRAGP